MLKELIYNEENREFEEGKSLYADKDTIPSSLQHESKHDEVQSALDLAEFLKVATYSIAYRARTEAIDPVTRKPTFSDKEMQPVFKGMNTVFDLLKDKIEIASNVMKWPYSVAPKKEGDIPQLGTVLISQD